MRQIYLDSFSHYQFQLQGDGTIALVQFVGDDDFEDCCPKMGDREPFTPQEGKIIHLLQKGEKVEFIYSSYKTVINENLLSPEVECGDDLSYRFKP